ncbi:MAG: hypothetical protein C3F06_13075 [Candidatus Methanoperedenaceae archaeon]|nr:MAG: hypothetical protein C3F06_13075 [Candidatus Methanoperedenaceae archaeon]
MPSKYLSRKKKDMKITNHALLRMRQRGIDENSVASAISNPDEIIDSFGNRKLARKTIGDKTIEVVFIKEDDITVITVYWLEET